MNDELMRVEQKGGWAQGRSAGEFVHLLNAAAAIALVAGSAVTAADCVKDSYGNVVCGKEECATAMRDPDSPAASNARDRSSM